MTGMWLPFVLFSLAAGLAALVYFLLANKTSWAGFNLSLRFLAIWLPGLSLVTLVFLCLLAARTGLRWPGAAALIVFLAAAQFCLLLASDVSPWTLCFLPVVLVCLSVFALAIG